jgi:hypothetical protein
MPKIVPVDVTALGFTAEMLGKKSESDFEDLIDSIISEQALLLQGRIGSAAYASASSPTKDYVKRAELCLVAAEIVQRRMNVILGNAVGAGRELDISHEGAQKKAYKDEAEALISRIAASVTSDPGSDFASGALVTDHFS